MNIKNNEAKNTTEEEMKTTTDRVVMGEMYAILEAVSDRIEMHSNIGEQRNNWNTLLLISINTTIIMAATMAGLVCIAGEGSPLLPLKLSSFLLYCAATGMLLVMNKIQPSQLAEEQRNAVRVFKQIHTQIQTTLAMGSLTSVDPESAMREVFTVDKAYPLPLLGGVMLDKFPKVVEPAIWWPQQQGIARTRMSGEEAKGNGWNAELEDQMRRIARVSGRKDTFEFVRLSKLVLKVNKVMAISGPILICTAALASFFVGSLPYGAWAAGFAIVGGALACIVNTVQHGGQVGMVFEMYRNCAGSFQKLKETIESTLEENEVERREHGDLFRMKVALQLGRSLSELEKISASCLPTDTDTFQEFCSKLL